MDADRQKNVASKEPALQSPALSALLTELADRARMHQQSWHAIDLKDEVQFSSVDARLW